MLSVGNNHQFLNRPFICHKLKTVHSLNYRIALEFTTKSSLQCLCREAISQLDKNDSLKRWNRVAFWYFATCGYQGIGFGIIYSVWNSCHVKNLFCNPRNVPWSRQCMHFRVDHVCPSKKPLFVSSKEGICTWASGNEPLHVPDQILTLAFSELR